VKVLRYDHCRRRRRRTLALRWSLALPGWCASTLLAILGSPAQAATAASAASAATSACNYLSKSVSAQPDGAVLLASYPTERRGALSNAAFTYDNSVAAIALVACRHTALARRIGDALLLALDHDRYWHDGRLRNGYAAGAIGPTPLKLAGWWDPKSQRWLEDDYQAGSDSGNIAWAMLALLTLHAASGDQRYRDGALQLARWVEGTLDTRGAGGFVGGYYGHEPAPQRQRWKSTEHNTDLAAAFGWLARLTGDAHWRARMALAEDFVAAMWRPDCGCYAVGTAEDGVTLNPLLALDAQVWPLMALPGGAKLSEPVLQTLDRRLRFQAGYSYSDAGGGLWIEGTAQVAVLLELLHRPAPARALRAAVERERSADGGYYATGAAAMPTGFMLATDPSMPRVYFHLEHLGAAAWAALAEQGYNPFAGGRRLAQ
jgi:hypothetical protein